MQPIAETHCHTVACNHAFSTVSENAAAAKQKGLKFLAITEHTPNMIGAPPHMFFVSLRILPPEIDGVTILKGAEVNIMNEKGELDLPESTMDRLDWIIASLHSPVLAPADKAVHTAAWMAVAENPYVDVIGHCGDSRYAFDEEPVIKAFAKHGKIVEINSHSFASRPGSTENCPRIARLCAKHGVPVVVSSDAHYHGQVGGFAPSVEMLERIGFPEELVLNADYGRFLAVAREKAGPHTKAHLESL